VGHRFGLDAVLKRKTPSPRRESNPRTPIVQLRIWFQDAVPGARVKRWMRKWVCTVTEKWLWKKWSWPTSRYCPEPGKLASICGFRLGFEPRQPLCCLAVGCYSVSNQLCAWQQSRTFIQSSCWSWRHAATVILFRRGCCHQNAQRILSNTQTEVVDLWVSRGGATSESTSCIESPFTLFRPVLLLVRSPAATTK